MQITKKLALMVAVSGLVGILPAWAEEAPPGAPPASADVPLAAGDKPQLIMATPAMPMEGDVVFMAETPEEDLLVALGPVGPGMGGPMGGPGHAFMRRMHGSPFADLNLTDEQYEKLWAIKRDSAGKMRRRWASW